MPELLEIDNIGIKGLNTDVAPWSLSPEFVTSGINFSTYAGSIYAAGGHELESLAASFNPGHLHYVSGLANDYWVVLGRSKVYAYSGGGVWSNISNPLGYGELGIDDELKWTCCNLGQITVCNNPQEHTEYWLSQGTTTVLQPLPWNATQTWSGKEYSCQTMRSHKNFLIAMDMQESDTHYPNTIRISTAADINGLPYTWDETDPAGIATRFQLSADGGAIIDGLSQRDNFVVYSETSINVLSFNPDSEFLWSIAELSNDIGVLSKNSIIDVRGTHYFLSDGDIYLNDGTNIQSILYGKIKTQFSQEINGQYYSRSYAIKNELQKEIWFCVPTGESKYPNTAYIYNWAGASWSVRTLAPDIRHSAYGAQSSPPVTWGTWSGNWGAQTRTWATDIQSPLKGVVMAVHTTSALFVLNSKTGADSPFEAASIERTDLPLRGHRHAFTLLSVYPYMKGSGKVLIEFGAQDFAGAPIRWSTGKVFNIGTDRKVDVRVTGALLCWRVSTFSEGQRGVGNWILSGMHLEYEPDGER